MGSGRRHGNFALIQKWLTLNVNICQAFFTSKFVSVQISENKLGGGTPDISQLVSTSFDRCSSQANLDGEELKEGTRLAPKFHTWVFLTSQVRCTLLCPRVFVVAVSSRDC